MIHALAMSEKEEAQLQKRFPPGTVVTSNSKKVQALVLAHVLTQPYTSKFGIIHSRWSVMALIENRVYTYYDLDVLRDCISLEELTDD